MAVLAATVVESPVGELTIVGSDEGLRAVLWPDDDPRRVPLADAVIGGGHPVLDEAIRELAEYFAGHRTWFTVALDPRGTDFQREVWRALLTIPFGETAGYGEIGRSIGRPQAARAVGAANGRNPLSIVVPCHRVVGADGSLTGFAGGLDAKRHLLEHERAVLAALRDGGASHPPGTTNGGQSQSVG